MKGLYEDIIPCWLTLALSSIHSPSDMCHSLIGWEKAQSMCFSLIQSGPSLSIPPSLHLDRRSSKPLANKSNPLPLKIITIIQSNIIMPLWNHKPSKSKAIMPNWEPKSYQFAIIIHHPHPNPKSISIEAILKLSWAHIHPKSPNRPIPTTR